MNISPPTRQQIYFQSLKVLKSNLSQQKPTNCLSVFHHFVGLALKGLKYSEFVQNEQERYQIAGVCLGLC